MHGYDFDARLASEFSCSLIAGVDEVGRGPLAGPVVAAAVILPPSPQIVGLRDSKMVPQEQREALFTEIQDVALSYSIVEISHEIIDEINILQASLRAMRQAVLELSSAPGLVVVDGNQKPKTGYREIAVVKGDQKSAAVMAASILAKVTRDHIMWEEHQKYPLYGFDGHKGYGCESHLTALRRFGPCPIHRKSFEPVRSSPQLIRGEHEYAQPELWR